MQKWWEEFISPAHGYGADAILCIRVPLNLLVSSGEKFNKYFLDHGISINEHIFSGCINCRIRNLN